MIKTQNSDTQPYDCRTYISYWPASLFRSPVLTDRPGFTARDHECERFGRESSRLYAVWRRALCRCGWPHYGHGFCGGGDSNRKKFTGYERDSETGLDFAQARHFSSSQGRFTSADSLLGSLANPQSLNRYAYVGIRSFNPLQMRLEASKFGPREQ
ncbi:MAG TPA: RHS repeat-associated core domain-containing protein [Pyrinomonadaceae bacterium]|jgi:RHS repeat-associated protein